ncbi:site-specific integrase [Eisenbergiella porci]|uniref:site-specific integrase n=1 Tax=Eisenbergiella porci TaxID=2652274 RepID=UPI002A81C990|nr:site-specific integrase [Eisenbergiella porci]
MLKEAEHGDHTCLGILLSGCSGIRIGELCALQWKDIQFEKGTLAIRKTMQRIRTFETVWAEGKPVTRTGTKVVVAGPKSRNSNREIPLPEHLLKLLEKMSGVKEGYVMPGKKKEYTEPRTLQYRFQRILKELGIPAFNFHMLRHIFATNCIMQGFDMKSLSEILGHSNVSTTMRIYVHSDMERKKQLMAGYRMAVA